MQRHNYSDLVRLFNDLFARDENTRLLRGFDEPIYWPPDAHIPWARLVFARGFFASALHEIAHWCIAGPERRKQVDFGYWYVPDGRSAEQQQAFQQVEVKPQALEWIFADACGWPFSISADNLSGESGDDSEFRRSVLAQVWRYCDEGLPPRAGRFRSALASFYQGGRPLSVQAFTAGAIGLAVPERGVRR